MRMRPGSAVLFRAFIGSSATRGGPRNPRVRMRCVRSSRAPSLVPHRRLCIARAWLRSSPERRHIWTRVWCVIAARAATGLDGVWHPRHPGGRPGVGCVPMPASRATRARHGAGAPGRAPRGQGRGARDAARRHSSGTRECPEIIVYLSAGRHTNHGSARIRMVSIESHERSRSDNAQRTRSVISTLELLSRSEIRILNLSRFE